MSWLQNLSIARRRLVTASPSTPFQPTRRAFIGTGLAFLAAPAIVRATSLMPVKAFAPVASPLWQPGPGAYFLRDPRILLTPEMIVEGLASGKFFAHQSAFTGLTHHGFPR